MAVTTKIEFLNLQRWEELIKYCELRQLEREVAHLYSKKEGRGLTDWEKSRLRQLPKEIQSLRAGAPQ